MTSRAWRKVVVAVVAIELGAVIVGVAFGASAQMAGSPPDLTAMIFDGIQKAGALSAVVLFGMWFEMRARWREEVDQRLARDKERDGLLERVLEGLNSASQSVTKSSETAARAVEATESLANYIREKFPQLGAR